MTQRTEHIYVTHLAHRMLIVLNSTVNVGLAKAFTYGTCARALGYVRYLQIRVVLLCQSGL